MRKSDRLRWKRELRLRVIFMEDKLLPHSNALRQTYIINTSACKVLYLPLYKLLPSFSKHLRMKEIKKWPKNKILINLIELQSLQRSTKTFLHVSNTRKKFCRAQISDWRRLGSFSRIPSFASVP